MLIADTHIHSCFSSDAEVSVESMLEAALEKGMKIFYLTDHHDFDYPVGEDGRDFLLDWEAYLAKFAQLREQYQGKMLIRTGVEMGLMVQAAEKINEVLARYPLDFVIGSSHLVQGMDPYYPEYYQNRTEKQAYEAYFLSILENIQCFHQFDVYGHLDYVIRYGPNQDRFYAPLDYKDLFVTLLQKLIEKGKGIEINTGSLYKGFSYPHPHRDILTLYRQLGGEIITVGSDAHHPKHIAYGFKQAETLLRDLGFGYYTVFEQRQPQFIKL